MNVPNVMWINKARHKRIKFTQSSKTGRAQLSCLGMHTWVLMQIKANFPLKSQEQ